MDRILRWDLCECPRRCTHVATSVSRDELELWASIVGCPPAPSATRPSRPATLAALVGAGGLGDPIVTGLALAHSRLILSGAIPGTVVAEVLRDQKAGRIRELQAQGKAVLMSLSTVIVAINAQLLRRTDLG